MRYPQHPVAGSTALRVALRTSDQGSNTSELTRPRGRMCANETVRENPAPVATGYSCSSEHWLKLEGKDREEWNVSQRDLYSFFESRQGEQDIFFLFLCVNF